jgi:hypothetical protein
MLLMLLRKKLNRTEMKRRRLMTETLKVTRTWTMCLWTPKLLSSSQEQKWLSLQLKVVSVKWKRLKRRLMAKLKLKALNRTTKPVAMLSSQVK